MALEAQPPFFMVERSAQGGAPRFLFLAKTMICGAPGLFRLRKKKAQQKKARAEDTAESEGAVIDGYRRGQSS